MVFLFFIMLLATAGCGKSTSVETYDWLPKNDLGKALLSVSVDVKEGQPVSARARLASQGDRQRNVTWDQGNPTQLVYGDTEAAPWQSQLTMPFTVETVIPYLQAVRGWIQETLPDQPEFQVGFQADYTNDLQKIAQERAQSAKADGQTMLVYSLETKEIASWAGETAPSDLLGYGTLSGITPKGEQLYYAIWIVAN